MVPKVQESVAMNQEPNTACTRRVGVAAFSGTCRGFRFILLPSVLSSRPPAGNAHRWAGTLEELFHAHVRTD